jgi:hypothetical protein
MSNVPHGIINSPIVIGANDPVIIFATRIERM